ncbi:MAG: hypothetical protein P1U81_14285 [Verrucomicrobiales bacterium]|nr:hypothetical protein [Verrucomicrobiales bacterium]
MSTGQSHGIVLENWFDKVGIDQLKIYDQGTFLQTGSKLSRSFSKDDHGHGPIIFFENRTTKQRE